MASFSITKITKEVSTSGKDEYTHALPEFRKTLAKKNGGIFPALFKFRLLDDDGIVYFYGRCTSDSSFAPLDNYGSAYGCTDIQYKNLATGVYESL